MVAGGDRGPHAADCARASTSKFHIEHPFGCQGQAWKNFYSLAQVAHLLQQLLYRWRALRVVRQCVGAIYRFIAEFAHDIRTLMPPDADTVEPAFQLRLDTTRDRAGQGVLTE